MTNRLHAFLSIALAILIPATEAGAQEPSQQPSRMAAPLVQMHAEASAGLLWHTARSSGALTLSVSGPADFSHQAQFERGATPFLPLVNSLGQRLPDGLYSYEFVERLEFAPHLAAGLRSARQAGDEALVQSLLASEGTPPTATKQTGFFRVHEGLIVTPDSLSESTASVSSGPQVDVGDPAVSKPPFGDDDDDGDGDGDGDDFWPGDGGIPEDQVILDDLIVDGNLCAGIDCVDGESFSTDTLRLKANNLRIHFDDTSSSASFPRNDWRIEVNDDANGGADYFGIEDTTAGRMPFRVLAGAQDDALFLTSNKVGFGTAAPVVELHVVDGDTPTLRLDQDGSNGFTPQTWDVAGNEAGFFIRDVTNGSTLPFRLIDGAPSSSIHIGSNGDVGFGSSSPQHPIHVRRLDGTAKILVEELTSTPDDRSLLELSNEGGVAIDLTNTRLGNMWSLGTSNADEFRITTDGLTQLRLDDDGNLSVPGAMNQLSDVGAKHGFEPVDGAEILEKVVSLPLSSWSYRHDDTEARHLGPMAQDFRAAFALGADERHIAPMDVSGVTLVAVQQLNSRILELESLVGALSARLEALEAAQSEAK